MGSSPMQKIREGNVTDAKEMQETSNKAGPQRPEVLMGKCQELLSRQEDGKAEFNRSQNYAEFQL